ncbi:MAG TPA: nucleotidyltransferase domain-containing protein [Bryobacteraceae bacterium]|nr:nucleotidyltransferase domain-containing protein [Bryobacteraceae bacterium]
MSAAAIEIREEQIADFCRRNGIQKLSLFGSVLTSHFSPASDVDVLVEFEPGLRVGYLRMAALERELSALFDGRKIDLRTPAELSKYFRAEVMQSAAVQYAAR